MEVIEFYFYIFLKYKIFCRNKNEILMNFIKIVYDNGKYKFKNVIIFFNYNNGLKFSLSS